MRPEHHVLASELEEIFRNSLQTQPSAAAARDSWLQSGAREKALHFIERNGEAAAALREGRSRIAVINEPSLVHMLWLLELDPSVVNRYLEVLLDESITRFFPHTKFWAAYSTAMALFSGRQITVRPKPKLSGYEKFWEPYFDYMAGTIFLDHFEQRAASSFTARNSQSRYLDWRSLDGDAKARVNWDFRYAAIMKQERHLSR